MNARFAIAFFAPELEGYRILTNRSHWRQFPVDNCENWHFDNVV